jgi:subtilisin family serine protease
MKIKQLYLIGALFLTVALAGCKKSGTVPGNDSLGNKAAGAEEFMSGTPIANQYIVVYANNYASQLKGQFKVTPNYKEREKLSAANNAKFLAEFNLPASAIIFNYHSSIAGFTATLNQKALASIKADPRVAYVEQDKVISLGKPSGGGGSTPVQVTPIGITRVGGSTTTNNMAWIIDTGIDSLHPDIKSHCGFVGGTWMGISFITTGTNAHSSFDQNGHGTHVSGTISGIGTGVYGVVPGAEVIPVRVLDASGSGSNSGVIKGIDYVGANAAAGDVANMSLGGSYSKSLNDAVVAASSNGVFFAIAAGNSSAAIYFNFSPASALGPNIYTVTAMSTAVNGTGWTDVFASFSNYGDLQTGGNIVYCDPGVSVLSDYAGTLKGSKYSGGSYATLSGTSMATPHMAGILLAKGAVTSNGSVVNDPDGSADPVGHE